MPTHNRYVGGCLEMALNGQVKKGVLLYNRWAVAARHTQVKFISDNPATIEFDVGFIRQKGNELEFLKCLN
jgi:hypothetical protein